MLKKVLIVDDSPAQVKLMQGLLEPEGYQPVGINDPKRVEEAIANERPSLILLDVVMPDRNGFQVCRELKSSNEPVERKLSPDSAKNDKIERLALDEKKFRWLMNENAMATEKLSEGIRIFNADAVKLEQHLAGRL